MAENVKKSDELNNFLDAKVKSHLSCTEYDELRMMINELIVESMVEAFIKGKERWKESRRADDGRE